MIVNPLCFTAKVTHQKPDESGFRHQDAFYRCRTLKPACERAIFRANCALVSDVKMGCNHAGFNYRGHSRRQSWTRPSMNRNTRVSESRDRCSRESSCWKGSESCISPLKSLKSNSDSRENLSYWMCPFHLQLFRTTGQNETERKETRETLLHFPAKKKKVGGHMLGKAAALLLSFISSGFGCAVLFLRETQKDFVSIYHSIVKAGFLRMHVGCGAFILLHFSHVDLLLFCMQW